jgi:hypothetical protein
VSGSSGRVSSALTVALLLVTHAGLLAYSAWQHSPVAPEVFHLPAGVSHWRLGRFDLFRVNPPLVRTVAAVPVLGASPRTNWATYLPDPLYRAEYGVGLDFFEANGPRSFWLVTLGRWACIPFSLVGAYVSFRWAGRLYGASAGLVACTLWCFSPYILGHASLMTPDAHAAAMGLAAAYTFWLWLREPHWPRAVVAGLVLGVAELTKSTLIVFFALWPVLWVAYRLGARREMGARRWLGQTGMLVGMLMLGTLVINVGYGFEGSLQRLADYRFRTRTLTGIDSREDVPKEGANRFADTWLGSLPVPLPKNYLQGIDTQKVDFEQDSWSYLRGRWQRGGWWYYYLYALAVKVPLGTWALVLLAVLAGLFRTGYVPSWRDDLVLLLPAVVILALVSSQKTMSVHSRYLLPGLPFVFIWASKSARAFSLGQGSMARIAALALCWSVASSLWIYPYSLSYFNELVGGPAGGYAHLSESNISWNQDLSYLSRWLDAHPEARPLYLASFGPLDPRLAGIEEFTVPPVGPAVPHVLPDLPEEELGPFPGWYAIDVNFLAKHAPLSASDGKGGWEHPFGDGYDLTYFQHFPPLALVGYSFRVYHLTFDEANRVRCELGLPELREDQVQNATSAETERS